MRRPCEVCRSAPGCPGVTPPTRVITRCRVRVVCEPILKLNDARRVHLPAGRIDVEPFAGSDKEWV